MQCDDFHNILISSSALIREYVFFFALFAMFQLDKDFDSISNGLFQCLQHKRAFSQEKSPLANHLQQMGGAQLEILPDPKNTRS
jgi:hypothetical protein